MQELKVAKKKLLQLSLQDLIMQLKAALFRSKFLKSLHMKIVGLSIKANSKFKNLSKNTNSNLKKQDLIL
jgi:hypothetical protein